MYVILLAHHSLGDGGNEVKDLIRPDQYN